MSTIVDMALTVGGLLDQATARLAAAGIDEPRREARLVVALALGLDPAALLGWPERSVAADGAAAAEALVARRARHEPFSRLKGSREFWSLDFALSPETLDPRSDSETLVSAALDDVADRTARLQVVDFGTGTGCLLLALLSELPEASGLGIDISPGAVDIARRNAAALGLAGRIEFRVGGWESINDDRADVILANPPYIPSSEIAKLALNVLDYDPTAALDGGADGLAAYRGLAPAIRRSLVPGGRAYIEIGAGQAEAVASILAESRLRVRVVRQDLAGIQRCLIATL